MPSASTPSFAVVLPAFDRESTIVRSIRSVITAIDELERATGATAELIVVDDGSADATAVVAADLARDERRMRVVRQSNAGVSAARNAGADAAAPEAYLVFLDCDDVVEPGWLIGFHRAVSRPGSRPSLVFCDASADHADGRSEHWFAEPLGPAFADIAGRFNPGMFCVEGAAFRAAGGYAVGLRFSENTELSLRLTAHLAREHAPIETARVAETLVRIAVPDRPGGSNAYSDENRFASALYIAATHGDRLRQIDPGFVARYWSVAGVAAARLGRGATARRCFVHAARLQPRRLRFLAQAVTASVPPLRRRQWPAIR